jgi:hypothetical protein
MTDVSDERVVQRNARENLTEIKILEQYSQYVCVLCVEPNV